MAETDILQGVCVRFFLSTPRDIISLYARLPLPFLPAQDDFAELQILKTRSPAHELHGGYLLSLWKKHRRDTHS